MPPAAADGGGAAGVCTRAGWEMKTKIPLTRSLNPQYINIKKSNTKESWRNQQWKPKRLQMKLISWNILLGLVIPPATLLHLCKMLQGSVWDCYFPTFSPEVISSRPKVFKTRGRRMNVTYIWINPDRPRDLDFYIQLPSSCLHLDI